MAQSTSTENLESALGIKFKNPNFLEEALTHRSYLNENPKWPYPHNERLEYLGDAVLEFIVTEKLFRKFPEEPEGQLTVLRAALVNYQILGDIAGEIGLEPYLYMSRGERADKAKAKEVILANAIEALIGAIHLDQGVGVAEKFVNKYIWPRLGEILKTRSYRDAKSELQELIQDRMKLTPTYRVLEETGPAHQRKFGIGVYFGDELIAEGEGLSKQEAEVEAAKEALKKYK